MRLGNVKAWIAVLGAAGLLVAPAAAAQQATVTGRVTEEGSNEPVPEARILVVGTTLGASTNADGRYTLRGVPAGQVTVRVIRIGYQESKKPVTVAAGEQASLDFSVTRAVLQLQEMVTTATGEQRHVEQGNVINQIDASKLHETSPIANMNDVLQARTPGLALTASTQTGSGSRIRIRGQQSLSLSNDPIYIIDGIRMTNNSSSSQLFTGGAQPSRVGDINPDEIENIEIVKGPSAATLYGTDAANGVIVITTKKGRAGQTRWNAWAEAGLIKDRNDYPLAYTLAGHSPGSAAYRECTLPQISAGSCVQDSLRTLNVFDDPETTFLGTGDRQQYGLNVAGGTDALRYFISGEFEKEDGLLELPTFEVRRFGEAGLAIREDVERPNALKRYSVRANFNSQLHPTLDVALNTSYIDLTQRFSQESNATAGLGSQAFGGKGYKESGVVAQTGTSLFGFRAWTPAYTFQELVQQQVNRFIGSANGNWRPTSWLANRANVGLDFTSRVDNNLLRNGEGPPLTATYRRGFKGNYRANISNLSVDLASTASVQPWQWLNAKTTVGAQYVNYYLRNNTAEGEELPPGALTPNAGALLDAEEVNSLEKTLGLFGEEAFAIRDRLFLTLAVRSDQNSAFGERFKRVFYPKASASWILSEEDFFPKPSWLGQFRLRTAYGASGRQPGPNDAYRAYTAIGYNVRATDVGGLVFDSIGNTDLKPEKATEFESGFELRLFDRVLFDVTYYNKLNKDAIIAAIVPPSWGVGRTYKANLGKVKNRGWELLVESRILNSRNIGLDLTLTGSTNKNTLVSRGGLPPQETATSRAQVGYPLFGYWQRKINRIDDKNGDGIITYSANETLNELFIDDSSTFVGSSSPRHLATLNAGLELFQRKVRISTLFDYKGGHYLLNDTERIRCGSRANCRGLNDRTASLKQQAAVVAFRDHPARSVHGWMEKADAVRFRELAVTVTPPDSWARRVVRGRSLSLTFAARNLATWTDYTGVDPETDFNASADSDNPAEFQTLGPPTYFTFRLNVGW